MSNSVENTVGQEPAMNTRSSLPRTASRRIALFAFCMVALNCTACSRLSNNHDKIVGKWRIVSISAATESENAALNGGQASVIFEFTADGKASVTIEVMGQRETSSGRYTLLPEDFVEFSDFPGHKQKGGGFLGPIKGKDQFRVTIAGDDMTVMTLDETMKLKRVK